MRMQDVLPLLDQAEKTEAIAAIQSIVAAPMGKEGRVRISLANEFSRGIEIKGEKIHLTAQITVVVTDKKGFLACFKCFVLETDEILSELACLPNEHTATTKKKMNIIVLPPPAPDGMDIPIWDEERNEWYDAEI